MITQRPDLSVAEEVGLGSKGGGKVETVLYSVHSGGCSLNEWRYLSYTTGQIVTLNKYIIFYDLYGYRTHFSL
jgi:hypothetical protein